MNYKLYFQNSRNQRIFISDVENKENITQLIYKDLEVRAQPSFKCYYIRYWAHENGEIIYDCGSWSEFYIAVLVS